MGELINKQDVLDIINNENFTVERKFERIKGLKGISGKWINLEETKKHFDRISNLDKDQIIHILNRIPTIGGDNK